jgi:hypothetical protein
MDPVVVVVTEPSRSGNSKNFRENRTIATKKMKRSRASEKL